MLLSLKQSSLSCEPSPQERLIIFMHQRHNEASLACLNLSKKGYRFVKMYKNHFVKFPRYACFFDCLDKGRRIGPRSGRAGPSFSARPEKEAKGAVLHGTSAAERLRHVHNFGNPHRNSRWESDKTQNSRSDGNFSGPERPMP